MAEGAPHDFVLHSVICRHHVHKCVWTPVVGEELLLQRDLSNSYDAFAVAIMKGRRVVGHVPIELSFSLCTIIQRGGDICDWQQDSRQTTRGSMHLQIQG